MADNAAKMREALVRIARITETALNETQDQRLESEQDEARSNDSTSLPRRRIQVFYGEKDACSKHNVVTVPGKDGRVEIRAGETRFVELESMVASFYWRCGDTEEKFRYDNCPPFNEIKVERSADTGRIAWTCYVLT